MCEETREEGARREVELWGRQPGEDFVFFPGGPRSVILQGRIKGPGPKFVEVVLMRHLSGQRGYFVRTRASASGEDGDWEFNETREFPRDQPEQALEAFQRGLTL